MHNHITIFLLLTLLQWYTTSGKLFSTDGLTGDGSSSGGGILKSSTPQQKHAYKGYLREAQVQRYINGNKGTGSSSSSSSSRNGNSVGAAVRSSSSSQSTLKMAVSTHAPDLKAQLSDPPANFTIAEFGAPVMVGGPISIYYIFYGNFTALEKSRIENYAQSVSSATTYPKTWTIATSYFDSFGHYVSNTLLHGGSVTDSSYTFGKNLSTTVDVNFNGNGVVPAGLSDQTDLGKLILSHIGSGKSFEYDPLGIYTVVTAPEVFNQDWTVGAPYPAIFYRAYHFSFNATVDGQTRTVNHAFVHSIDLQDPKFNPKGLVNADLETLPNGDTGRALVDVAVDALHHEFFEALSDPAPNTAWNDNNPNFGIGENGDACEYTTSYFAKVHWTAPNVTNSKAPNGRYYNSIINDQIYSIQDIWALDKNGAQGCYNEVLDTAFNEFKSVKAVNDPVIASDGKQYKSGGSYIPCRAFYVDRYHGGYTTPGSNICHIYFEGRSTSGQLESGPLDIPNNMHVLSKSFAQYQWVRTDDSNAIIVYPEDSNKNVPLVNGNMTFVVFQDSWVKTVIDTTTKKWRLEDGGAWYCGTPHT
ncbi:hypothetical protein HDU76_011897 [Blyttiomyces sp. JEL0837]|nr:hypothetical protein HDU76_011897 [Blyttiomyces sp. JEL0837]